MAVPTPVCLYPEATDAVPAYLVGVAPANTPPSAHTQNQPPLRWPLQDVSQIHLFSDKRGACAHLTMSSVLPALTVPSLPRRA